MCMCVYVPVCVCSEGTSGETQQAIRDRLQHLEKELFFYKSSSRQLKKKLRECLGDTSSPADQPSNTQKHREAHIIEMHPSAKETQTHTEGPHKGTRITTAYTKIRTGPAHEKTCNDSLMRRHVHQTTRPSSSSDFQTHKQTEVPEYDQTHTQSHRGNERGAVHPGISKELTPVRLCRRELRQISPGDLQVCGSATRRRQSTVDTSTESILEDSIEVARKITNEAKD